MKTEDLVVALVADVRPVTVLASPARRFSRWLVVAAAAAAATALAIGVRADLGAMFARGLLAGTRTREGEKLTLRAGTDPFGDSLYDPSVDFAVVDRVTEVAAARGVPSAQVALAWLLKRPGVTAPIVGASKDGHVEDALAAEQLELTAEEVARLEEAYVPHAVSGHE